ncbi:MAG: hypothetical protein SXU28_02975 [Pseudomonadota bacterium]|nr:hypothetical protein [Pseudomonadota bacterium]
MKWIALLFAAVQMLVLSGPAYAQQSAAYRTVSTTSWVEEWDATQQRWVRVSETAPARRAQAESRAPKSHQLTTTRVESLPANMKATTRVYEASRFALPMQVPAVANRASAAIAQYGPFMVLDGKRAAMMGSTDTNSPRYFEAMLRDFPNIELLEMVEAPGTSNDIANLEVGRRIRAAGISTHVPRGGSVRSGAVELFLAGANRTMEDGAQFAVHAWMDNYGRQPKDFAPDSDANRLYLDYYTEMGFSEKRAREFYAMTNSVPHASAKWLGANEMRGWIRPERAPAARSVVTFAKARFEIEAAQTGPIMLNHAYFDAPVVLAAAPIVEDAPVIDYADIGTIMIANASAAQTYTFLDS